MKSIKKVLASVLALAMVVTAAPATTAEAATTGVPKTKTYYAGKSYTLTLTTPKSWKSVKTTWSEKNSAISLSSKKTKSVKVKAIKATKKATVKVKVTYKKSSKKGAKKYTKNYKTVITIKNPSVSAPKTAEVETGATVSVKATATPSSAKVTYKSSDDAVATVDAQGVVTGVKAGTATITATATYGTVKKTAKTVVTVKDAAPVVYTIEMTSLQVTAADTLVAKFAHTVKTDNTTFALTRGTTTVEILSTTWNADATEVTIKTAAKMTPGDYTLTATDKTDATITSSKTATVEKQKATEIKILNDVALTGKGTVNGTPNQDAGVAYAYYDVVDQYGNSMRNSVSISWSSSTGNPQVNVANGQLTFKRSDGKAFTYGEQLFVTGVDTKTGLSVNKTLTIGAAQAVNSVELAGFIKKGTTDILTSLPKDFKDKAYYMLYNVLDQNGNPIQAGHVQVNDADKSIKDITFVSDTPLVVSKIVTAGQTATINDKEYNTVLVEPGIKVEQGGEVTVTAIANNTGNKTSLKVPVNVSEVLKSFVIGTPGDIVTDGASVEIPFEATDTKGNKITNFETIAKQATFNKLQLNASVGTLTLSQGDDGTAHLVFSDTNMPWTDSQTTDGQDRIASLTAIVIGGDTNNQMINIQDKARPTGVSGVHFNSAYLEGDSTNIALTKKDNKDEAYISYVDQYGRKMDSQAALDFFTASANGTISGTDFSNYVYGTMVTYTGNGNQSVVAEKKNLVSGKNEDIFLVAGNAATADQGTVGKVKVTMNGKLDGKTAVSGEGFKFAVTKVKKNGTNDYEYTNLDNAKNFTYDIIPITKVNGLTVKDINKIFVQTIYTTDKGYSQLTSTITGGAVLDASASIPTNYSGINYADNEVNVVGTYNGKEIGVPKLYYTFTGSIFSSSDNSKKINSVTASAISADMLYSFKSASTNYASKDGEDTLTVTVNDKYGATVKVADLKKTVKFSDAAPAGTTLVAKAETVTLRPNKTKLFDTANGIADKKIVVVNGKAYDDTNPNQDDDDYRYDVYYDSIGESGLFELKDQYGKDCTSLLVYEVKDVKEADAYAANNFTVDGNSTGNLKVAYGAERGDEFTVVASKGQLNASIKITVGADKQANITSANSKNNYLDVLIGDGKAAGNGLEYQRLQGLGAN